MKSFFTSKLNWVGIITATIGFLGLATQLDLSTETMKGVMLATGVLTVILRTFFTDTRIRTKNN